MPDRPGPQVYSIAAHRGFADALVAGLVPRYAESDFGLARLTLLLPSRRAVRIVTEAMVRHSGAGMLLPRMTVVGDIDLDETLGPLLDPLGAADIPPAADPTRRWLRLAEHLRTVEGEAAGAGAVLLRRAFEIGRSMDRLAIEGIAPVDLMSDEVIGLVGELAEHWREATRTFLMVQQHWIADLAACGEVDAPERRNRLFDYAAQHWVKAPPANPVVAAGVTSASPALARLLRVVSELPRGSVILPDLDLALDKEVWDALGTAGAPVEPGDPPFGRNDAVTHPQYHLKLLLHRMGIARDEVQTWHRAGLAASPPERSRAISNLFLPPTPSARWSQLAAKDRRLAGVRLMESATPAAEAQAIAVLIRQALEVPERRVALVTPDRNLAGRVVVQLGRWGIVADDTAGRPLPQTAAARVLLLLAELIAEQAAPVPLIALLTHPLVAAGEERAMWLEQARALDLALRGPRPGPGLEPLRAKAEEARLGEWWTGVEATLAPLFVHGEEALLSELIDAVAAGGEALCGEGLWSRPDGRALAQFVEDLREAARQTQSRLDPAELHAVLRDAMERVSVRPPWGGHPRVAIYGLLEARMSRADLVICGGLVEGVWPASPSPDALLPPALLRALGVPGADFRIGLSAHDLAAALGAPEVVLSWARRDESSPVIPSRFVLRVKAMLGDKAAAELVEQDAVRLARLIDEAPAASPYPRPKPMPTAEQRRVALSVTGLDRLRGDPYQFYANAILRLRALDPLDAEPSAAWKGTAVHAILDRWHKAGEPPAMLRNIAEEVMDELSAHPLMRALWRPRLLAALDWVGEEIAGQRASGRRVLATEVDGRIEWRGVRLQARADRIDACEDGALAVIDYKTGQPPSARRVQEGFALQLGLIGLIASHGGFKDAVGETITGEAQRFEYWSLAKQAGKEQFGYWTEPVLEGNRKSGIARDRFLPETIRYLDDALDRWILGGEPFTARLNPDLPGYADYDQLMRLDEWIVQLGGEDAA
ncbi:ATP-dependent helicase/nuclease subunit B [Novosphingobium chloroacetimidivorans]|uniref:ATP-dependent helicase/nuclease subunit B n=1 Tax=Novosphingobium chloroacetimidivorans TaxID=1428314 RepID=A0A7W7KBL6_9SPHN|nr:PD-(D/E)XK nuclease family protein [Novosphingobium chloroacetimidivorans]MBB4859825.1 ATP-dependent helicase/nuclease subunit B [Novosphingobium chloroacetimidivorans]